MVLLLRLLVRTLLFVVETIVAILTGGVYRRRFLIGELPVQRNKYSRRLHPSRRHASLRLPERRPPRRRPGSSSPSEEDNGPAEDGLTTLASRHKLQQVICQRRLRRTSSNRPNKNTFAGMNKLFTMFAVVECLCISRVLSNYPPSLQT